MNLDGPLRGINRALLFEELTRRDPNFPAGKKRYYTIWDGTTYSYHSPAKIPKEYSNLFFNVMCVDTNENEVCTTNVHVLSSHVRGDVKRPHRVLLDCPTCKALGKDKPIPFGRWNQHQRAHK